MISIFLSVLIFVGQASDVDVTNSEEYRTNSGEEFKDPFADPEIGVPEEEPTEPETQEEQPATEQEPDVQGSEAEPEAPSLEDSIEPAAGPSIDAPAVKSPDEEFQLPAVEQPRGPISEDFGAREIFDSSTKEGAWSLEFTTGLGANLKRRQNQVYLETKAGYRLDDHLELNAVGYFRFVKDRMLGFLFYPTYTWRVTKREAKRIDVYAGLGTGWTLLGVRGNDFQIGYWPLRVGSGGLYYLQPDFALVANLSIETYLMSVDTDGKYRGFLGGSDGMPAQILLGAGVRLEF